MTERSGQRGFSVIEALVAVAIVAIAFVALATLHIQVSRTFAEQRLLRDQVSAQRNALALLRDINIMERPVGSMALGAGRQLRWSATPISRPTRTTNNGFGFGGFEVVLYRVSVELAPPQGSSPLLFTIDKVGWRPVSTAATAIRTE